MTSKQFQWSKENSFHLLKVAGWTATSAIVSSMIVLIGDIDFPPQYLFIVSIVNTLLVATKEWINKKR
jgi:hypothetical protein